MAGNTIKGIKVTIGGDSKGLHEALTGINKDANAIQRELNLVNKSLKFDPTNAVLLAQKQELLEEKISTTRKALEQLEDVQEQVEAQAKSGDLGADKYRAYQREVESTKSILNNLEKQLDQTKDEIGNLDDKAKKTDLSSFQKEIDNVKDSASKLKDELQSTAQDIGAGIAGAGGVAVTALMSFDSVESALNHIQAQTGKTDTEMSGFKDSLEAIYKGNYGEDMLDIANVMATVAQHTKETDPKKLQQITESAYALQDTFGYDYVESIRAAKMLVDQFGISYDEAFNLIVQGTQKGLDKNGDFLDTINEYSVHYKQQGYSAEEFFNSLEKGTEAGTFSIDKIGDAMKEFGIRTKDTAESTTEGFELLNLDADKMRASFAKGGDSARDATQKTLEALFSLDDKVKQNQAGVDLFGSMWEDLGIDGVKALMDVNGTADKTVASMEKIKDIEYDDLGNRLETLGRKAQTEIINPLVEDAYPIIEDGIDWVIDNLDSLLPLIKGLGKEVAIVWGVKKTTAIVSGVKNLFDNYKNLTKATSSATTAQKALNTAQKANVVSAIATAVLTLINAVETYQETEWENSSLKKEIDNVKECTEKWNDFSNELSSTVENINDTELSLKVDFENVNELKERLQEIIADGTIDESEKGEYKTIIDLLSEKVEGFDAHWNSLTLKEANGKITIDENITEVNQELNKFIENWEITQAKLTYTESYSNLLTEIDKANAEIASLDTADLETSKKELINYIFEKSNLSKKESKVLVDELINNNGNFDRAVESLNKKFKSGELNSKEYSNLEYDVRDSAYSSTNRMFGYNDFNHEATKRIKEYTDSIVENENAIDQAESTLNSLKDTSEDYMTALELLNGGQGRYNDYIQLSTQLNIPQEAVLALLKDKGIKTWDELEKKSVESTQKALEKFQQNFITAENGTRESLMYQVSLFQDTYNELLNDYNNGVPTVTQETLDTVKGLVSSAETELSEFTNNGIDNTKKTIQEKTPELEDQAKSTAEKTKESAKGVSFTPVAFKWFGEINDSIESEKENLENTGESAGKTIKTGFGNISLFSLGVNIILGLLNGMLNGEVFKKIGSVVGTVCSSIYNSFCNWWDMHSPAKKANPLGENIDYGVADGFEKGKPKLLKSVDNVSKDVFDRLNTNNQKYKFNLSATQAQLNKLSSGNIIPNTAVSHSKTINNTPNITLNISGVTINNDNDINTFAQKISDSLGDIIIQDGLEWG